MTEEPFEVELTPVDEHRTWRHRRHAAPPPAPTPLDPPERAGPPRDPSEGDGIVVSGPPPGADPPGGWLRSERARLATTAAVAAVVALLLGWMLGTASRGDPSVDEATTPDSLVDEMTPTTPESTVLPGEPIPPIPTTRPPRTTTTSTLPEIEIGSIAIDERIAGTPVELVGWNGDRIVEADLRNGATRTIPAVGVRSVESEFMQVGADWVLLASGMSDRVWIVRSDGAVEVAALGEPWTTRWIPGTDRFWLIDDESWPSSMTLTEVALDGSPTGVEVEFSPGASGFGGIWTVDPKGGVLAIIAGGVYALDADGAVLVGRGDLIAAGTHGTLLRTCDDVLDCGYVLVDRTTGDSRELVPVNADGEPVELESAMHFWGPPTPHQMSPDGQWAVVIVLDGDDSASGVIDLDSGLVTTLAQEWWPEQVNFSPDSRYAFHHYRGQPWVLDLESGDHFAVFAEPMHWDSFGVRDARSESAADPTTSPTTGGD